MLIICFHYLVLAAATLSPAGSISYQEPEILSQEKLYQASSINIGTGLFQLKIVYFVIQSADFKAFLTFWVTN